MYVERWRQFYRDLMAQGRVREIPADRITDVLGNLLYGTIFTNYFSGTTKSVEAQANDIIDVAFCGILAPRELDHWNKCQTSKARASNQPAAEVSK
jgi:hypothetical protein